MRAGLRIRLARSLIRAGLVAGLAAACSDGAAPLAPVELLAQEYVYRPCDGGAWTPAVPSASRTVVDIRLPHRDGSDGPPTKEQIAAVERAGGRILYRYNVGMVRAELDVAEVPGLVGLPPRVANYVRTVTDLDRRDVTLIVMLSHDLTDADIAAVQALGGQIRHRYDALEGYSVVIDDAAIPKVRALPGVKSLGANSVGCIGW
jgi:hypothetical protein